VAATIYAYATLPHYRDHITPIVNKLDAAGVTTGFIDTPGDIDPAIPIIVAGNSDAADAGTHRRPLVYVEHGAGQTYTGSYTPTHRHASYSGSNARVFRNVKLFICPNDVVAGRWNDSWPDTPAVAVGCPKLDRWHTDSLPAAEPNLVAWTWHVDYPSLSADTPETGTAIKHYRDHLPAIIERLALYGIRVLGHAHPRWEGQLEPMWRAAGADYTADPNDVFRRAACLVVDNTSMGPEFATLDRPVVWVNSPRWRRNIHHEGRFWVWPENQFQINTPDAAAPTIVAALHDPPDVAEARRRMVPLVYSYTDGTAATRAAQAILATVG
jgi:hypothetical protein